MSFAKFFAGAGYEDSLVDHLMFLGRYAGQSVEVLERRTRRELNKWASKVAEFLRKESGPSRDGRR